LPIDVPTKIILIILLAVCAWSEHYADMEKEACGTDEEVTRLDDGFSKGWLVRGARGGEPVEALFSDWECGGSQNAKDAARFFRDMLLMLR